MNDVRKMIYGTLTLFLLVLAFWLSVVYISACGLTFTCRQAAAKVDRTPIPTLIPAEALVPTKFVLSPATVTPLPALTPEAETHVTNNPDIARPSNPGGPGPAADLAGNVENGKKLFAANCEFCHAAEGVGGYPNPGSLDGTVPPLNPIDPTLKDPDPRIYATNIDLFIEHGSVPEALGGVPVRSMPAWGDRGALAPQEIADLIAYLISLNK
jgi:mono/diheme cytochrome c family protein